MEFKCGKLKNLNIESEAKDIQFLTELASCAESLMTGEVWPDGVNVLLKTLGEHFDVSRVWVFQLMNLTDEHITQDYIFEWASDPKYIQLGLSKFNMFTNPLGEGNYRRLMESRQRGEWQSIVTDRLGADFLKEDIASQAILSMLTVPLYVNGEWWGVLGYDDCVNPREWTASEIAFLRMAGLIMENMILRNQMTVREKQFSALNSVKESGLWSLDLKTWHIKFGSGIADVPLTNIHSAEYSLRNVLKIVHPDERKQILRFFRIGMSRIDRSIRQDIRVMKSDGAYKWVEIIGNAHFDASGVQTMLAGIVVDILNRKETEEKLKTEAMIDPLTGVMNRRAFAERLNYHIARSRMERSPFSLFMIDIDYFKQVNDRWGHSVGDMVLKCFTEHVTMMLRREDVFARYGGEEFIVLLPDTDRKGAELFGDRIRDQISRSSCVAGEDIVKVTASVGCTTYVGERKITASNIIDTADEALYRSKNSGRNTLTFLPLCLK
jgi:diguanylate cyclase (GGDEF)-like protein